MKESIESQFAQTTQELALKNTKANFLKLPPEEQKKLLIMLASTDQNLLIKEVKPLPEQEEFLLKQLRIVQETTQGTTLLNDLGIKLPNTPQLTIPDNKVLHNNVEAFNYNTEINHNYSKKELTLLLAKDFPDIQIRKAFIEIFFEGNGFIDHTSFSVIDTLNKIDQTINFPIKENSRVLNIGSTQEEVRQLTSQKNIQSRYSEDAKEKISSIKFKKNSNVEELPTENIIKKREELEEVTISLFCFCIIQLAKRQESILWVADPQNFPLEIPSWIKNKMQLIKSMSEIYEFKDFSTHLEQSLRAFLRVHHNIN